MFKAEYNESNQREIVLRDVEAAATEALIKFMYTGQVSIDVSNVQSLLPAARVFLLSDVVDSCCRFLREQLDAQNCLGIRNFASAHDCGELKGSADKFATQNFLDVVKSDEFLLLPDSQLVEIIKSDELKCPEEEDVYSAVMRWVYHDVKERKHRL